MRKDDDDWGQAGSLSRLTSLGQRLGTTLGTARESPQTTVGMRISKMKQRRCSDFVRIACFVRMHTPVSPEQVKISGTIDIRLSLRTPDLNPWRSKN